MAQSYLAHGFRGALVRLQRAAFHVNNGHRLFNATSAEIATAYSQVDAAAQLLRDITPGSGAYQNEAAVHEPNWQQSFWGATNYARLLAIKKRYDPNVCAALDPTVLLTRRSEPAPGLARRRLDRGGCFEAEILLLRLNFRAPCIWDIIGTSWNCTWFDWFQ
jgi:hypothetical protein